MPDRGLPVKALTVVRARARLSLPVVLIALTALSVSGADGTTTAKPRQPSGERPARQAALSSYRALPLAFVRNNGQLDRRVRYSAQAEGERVYLTRSAVTLALAVGRRGLALRLAFLGAAPDATITGAERSPGRVSYLIGNDPSRWQQNLPSYGEVVYRGLWPGIDLAVRGPGGQLKYEFRLAPGADPARIRLAYRGQERLSLDRDGELRVETALGLLRDGRPRSYQPISGRRVAVQSRFALGEGGAYGFALGHYDRRRPLVIDPGLAYSTYLGVGGGGGQGAAIAVDSAGSAYVVGSIASGSFPTTPGAFDRSSSGRDDAFVTKLNAAGSALAYSTYLGGRDDDDGSGIAIDVAGRAYVTGRTASRNFPTSAGAFDRSYNGRGDAFVTKLNARGSALAYSTYLGGRGNDWGDGIAVDGSGQAYVTGGTYSTDIPTTPGAFDRSSSGGNGDAFVTKLNAAGSTLAYSTYLGGSDEDGGGGIAVDKAGSAYVTGDTGEDFPTSAGAFDTSSNGYYDAFVTKLDAAGSALAYSTYLGGSDGDWGHGIAVDEAGRAYVTGNTASRNFPTTARAFDGSYNGGGDYGDAFVTKLNAAGSVLAYSTYLGGRYEDDGSGIAIDVAGRAYVTGSTRLGDFPTTAGAFDRSSNRSDDVFVTKLNAAGSALAYSTYLGGSDWGYGIAVDGARRAYVTGTTGANFPTTSGAFDASYNGGESDVFVAKLDLVAGPPSCIVPPVIGIRLAQAMRTIRAEHCSAGRVRRVRSRRVGRVLRQSPRAGSVRNRGFRVNLVVGRR